MAAFAAAWPGPLHILVNNAAIMGVPLTRTPDDWELPTNHLGHFALTTALRPALAAVGDARIVAVSSSGRLRRPPLRAAPLRPARRLRAVETTNALFAVEAKRRWAGDGITVHAVMPGVVRINLMRHVDRDLLARFEASGGQSQPGHGARAPVDHRPRQRRSRRAGCQPALLAPAC